MNSYIRYEAARQPEGPALILLDQRLLPGEERHLVCRCWQEAHAAIRDMAVRGAPAIGVAGAFACALAAHGVACDPDWRPKLSLALSAIAGARPTAVNLAWAVDRMREAVAGAADGESAAARLEQAALALQRQDAAVCEAIGRSGEPLLGDGDTVLTHCNAGALATAGSGTALAVIRAAWQAGRRIAVIADETRPLLQGSRLTAWELAREGIPVRVACDNACALLMSRGLVSLALTGADRIAANGDAANKIGTLGVAILARHFGLPFYIAAPLSTIDPGAPDGSAIAIEERSPEEVTRLGGQRLAPEGVGAFNFAFDVTPAKLISGIITEAGVLRPPYGPAIAAALGAPA